MQMCAIFSSLVAHGRTVVLLNGVMFLEARSGFLDRCDRAVTAINERYSYVPRTAIVVVTHAAGCIGIARGLANVTLQDVNPAAPCSIMRLTRSEQTDIWNLDHYAKEGALNAYTGHISDAGTTTRPWNNFGDKKVNRGYTGPPQETVVAKEEL